MAESRTATGIKARKAAASEGRAPCSRPVAVVLVTGLIVVCASLNALGHQPSDAATPASIEALSAMVGTWQVEVQMQRPDGASMSSDGRAEIRYGPAQRSLIIDYESTSGPMANFALHQIFTWDSAGEKFSLVWVDSFNTGATMVTGTEQGGSYVFDRRTGEGDVQTWSRSVYTAIEPNSFRAESFVSKDGEEWRPSMTLTYRRQSD